MRKLVRVTHSSLMRYSVGLLGVAAALLLAWPGLAENLFATRSTRGIFMSHGHC